MSVENNLPFLTERINEIKSAIFHSETSELIKIPVSIISILRTDESGWLWFFVKRPQQSMTEHEKSFPAHLQFYRKGKPFYIHVSGCAVIADDKDLVTEFATLTPELKDVALQNLSLIKLKMAKVEYYEHTPEITSPVVSKGLLQNLFTTIFKPSRYHRPVKLSLELA
jgi:general stress protein 26